jgi:hypothetical protein
LRWTDLASTDFIAYRDNLRAVGCPEKTIRDILEAELNHWFDQRRQPIVDAFQLRFWDLAAQQGEKAVEEVEDQLQRLLEDRERLLTAVLPEQTPARAIDRTPLRQTFARRYYWLPADLQSQLVDLDEQHWLATCEHGEEINRRESRESTPEDHARGEQLRSEYEAAQRALLGEFATEYDLRNSGSSWAARLAGFEPTEDEWRAVTMAQTELNAAINSAGPLPKYEALMFQRYGIVPGKGSVSGEASQAVADAQARYDSAVGDIFGPQRYAEYQRAGDEAYHQTQRVTQRLGLDDNDANHAWDIQRAAQAAMQQLHANPGLDATERQVALREITAEAAGALRSALGNRGFETYQEYAGAWLRTTTPEE